MSEKNVEVRTEAVADGFVYVIAENGVDRAPSRLWATEEKAKQAGEDFAAFLRDGTVVATPVPGTPSLKGSA